MCSENSIYNDSDENLDGVVLCSERCMTPSKAVRSRSYFNLRHKYKNLEIFETSRSNRCSVHIFTIMFERVFLPFKFRFLS